MSVCNARKSCKLIFRCSTKILFKSTKVYHYLENFYKKICDTAIQDYQSFNSNILVILTLIITFYTKVEGVPICS